MHCRLSLAVVALGAWPLFAAGDEAEVAAACQDFYQYACSDWLAANPLPPDRSRWAPPAKVTVENMGILRGILEKAAVPAPDRPPLDQKIGDFYAACMDEAAIEKAGLAPIEADLAAIAAVRDRTDLARLLARRQAMGVPGLFFLSSAADVQDSSRQMARLFQGRLGMPDPSFYLADTPQLVDTRQRYRAHVQRLLALAGDDAAAAETQARRVLEIETELARVSLDATARRDPTKIHHRMTLDALATLAPAFDWDTYFAEVGAKAFREVDVDAPDYLKGLSAALAARGLDDWKMYLRARLLASSADLLPAAFAEADFAFYGTAIRGTPAQRPRWQRCSDLTDTHLADALGRRYVETTLGRAGKEQVDEMVRKVTAAFARDLRALPWMGEATRERGLEKLQSVLLKVGHPAKWRDYADLRIERTAVLANVRRSAQFHHAEHMAKIGGPTDRGEWLMSAAQANAYYNPAENSINFPAGVLQPPIFDPAADAATNYGSLGGLVGHELTHGFDDLGRRYDARGNLAEWWTPEDRKGFEDRAACFADQYSGYTIAEGVPLNGRLTLGEVLADHGGVKIALGALRSRAVDPATEPKEGPTREQRFFLGYARVFCENVRDADAELRARTQRHPPARHRINGTFANMPDFQKAFDCPAGSPMVRAQPCRVW